jgi:L-glyceraldehyde 3-phosphate reductase
LYAAISNYPAERAEQAIAILRSLGTPPLIQPWLLQKRPVTSVLIGVSKVSQIDDCVAALKRVELSMEQLNAVESILNQPE